MQSSNREVVERFFAASERGDWDAVATMLDEGMVMEWPQSGERFRGRDNAVAAMRSQRVRPEVVGERRLIGSGDVWVVMVPLRYGTDLYHYVAVLEVEGGRIRRGTGFFGAPFPAQDYRAKYADKG